MAKVQGFINTIWEHADAVLSQYGRHVTYEDLYALCGEVVTDQQETKSAVASVNPAIRHFTDALKEQLGDSLLDSSNEPFTNLAYIANEANFLISGVVRELLSKSPDEVRGFDLLREAIDNLDRVTFVTLNHDLLLEQFLDENDIDFDDGFRKVNNGVEQYSPELLFDGPTDVTLIKPHGSINWYNDMDGGEYFSFSTIPPEPGLDHDNLRPEPSILSGYRKEEGYTTGIFGDMVDAFVLALHDTSTVIESGFG